MNRTIRQGLRIEILVAIALTALAFNSGCVHAETNGESIPSGIIWYGVLEDGIQEAKRTQRPIMFLAAAPQCAGVPGMW